MKRTIEAFMIMANFRTFDFELYCVPKYSTGAFGAGKKKRENSVTFQNFSAPSAPKMCHFSKKSPPLLGGHPPNRSLIYIYIYIYLYTYIYINSYKPLCP